MSATSIGTTGVWGLDHSEAGMILSDISFDYSIQDKLVLTIQGEVQGASLYGSKCEIKCSGLVTKTAPFSSKLGATITLTNAIPDHMPVSGGLTVIMGLSRNSTNEDFQKIDMHAVNYPAMTA